MKNQAIKGNLNNQSITIDLLQVISNMDINKSRKEKLALDVLRLIREQATVIWKDDRIEGVRLNKGIEKIELTIVINKDKEIEIKYGKSV